MPVLNSMWDLFWWFFWIYAFMAYLFTLFAVIRDLFRDQALNGWLKAVWILLLVFVPFITVLVYLIARGRGMAERGAQEQMAAQDATNDYIRDVAGNSAVDQIHKAKSLLDAGTINQQEYEALKAKALA